MQLQVLYTACLFEVLYDFFFEINDDRDRLNFYNTIKKAHTTLHPTPSS